MRVGWWDEEGVLKGSGKHWVMGNENMGMLQSTATMIQILIHFPIVPIPTLSCTAPPYCL